MDLRHLFGSAGESAAAAYLKKKALCILTVSDHIYTGESLAAKERETGFSQMAEIALKLANNI